MLTFRKALIIAAVLISLILFLRPSPSSSETPVAVSPEAVAEDISHETKEQSSSQLPSQDAGSQQQPLKQPPPPNASLAERLRYHFPYSLETKFPAYIWQTWKYTPASVWFDRDLRKQEASWTDLNPNFVHQVIPDDTVRYLIKYLYGSVPEVLEAFDALPLAVLKADFFRYLVLLARGGVYSDIDTTALKPVLDWLPSTLDLSTVGFVVGIEADPDRPDWADWYSRRVQFCQWTIQSKPGHPILIDIVSYITQETLRMKNAGILKKGKMDKTIVEFTGPAAWTDAVFRYFNDPEYFSIEPGSTHNLTYEDFTNQVEYQKVGDVVVLPITSFSPGVNQMNAQGTDDPMAFVEHDFEGTWKTDPSL
ncbi:hypothetical protein ASPVEDRAFT_720309 [Aspergillus versicolor CBS 583.65]|uniref:Alpha 1,4-glycosyltransferase domain-containing protein n=1 Tax=Aspergillus versicolor CBS 583.65 TaxID=1036611 RepID=A0A1L9PNX7_ASPVE|nr:uncharacterized protein ASPVEDRAFT_720309 [Aspergillus versicolor CBS 583.65]OJJ03234.1 hypothetical protein ASPVEDRAFT_720309 [Aspergillus versicolor CBS 583.65]